MAPFATDDSMDDSMIPQMLDDSDMSFTFEELEAWAQSCTDYDITKLTEDTGVDMPLPVPPSAVIVQPATPINNPANLLELQPVSPEMFLFDPVTPQPSPQDYYPMSDNSILQVVSPQPVPMQPASPATPGHPYHSSCLQAEPHSVEHVLSPYTVQVVEESTHMQSPYSVQVMVKDEATQPSINAPSAPKKRGRKRKPSEGTSAPRRNRSKKTKVYMLAPLADKEAERKRLNAVNSKRHRDMQKEERNSLALQLRTMTAERDNLLQLVQQLKLRLANKELNQELQSTVLQ